MNKIIKQNTSLELKIDFLTKNVVSTRPLREFIVNSEFYKPLEGFPLRTKEEFKEFEGVNAEKKRENLVQSLNL